MSLKLLQKQIGADAPKASSEAKSVTQPQARSRGGGAGGQSRGGAGAGGGGYYSSQAADAGYPSGGGGQSSSDGSGPRVLAPGVRGGFHGSATQSEHIRASQAAQRAAAAERPSEPISETLAVKSGLGLAAVEERKRLQEEERQAKREAARARRQGVVAQKEVQEEQAIVECEEQARQDSEQPRVKYEAALIVRIALAFGASGAWMKISEARTRGADIPLDPRKVFLLAHPDKCPMPEAADATAILNEQRPPEMTEVQAKAPRATPAPVAPAEPKAGQPASSPVQSAPAPAAKATAEEQRIDPEDGRACTFQELQQKYTGMYSNKEIEEYWASECRLKPKSKRF